MVAGGKQTAYIGLGSNLGDPEENICTALKLIRARGPSVTDVSSFYESRPEGPRDQPDFVNAVAALETPGSARSLLECLQEIELEMGRVRSRRWGPRVIDLDVLLFGDSIIREPEIIIPHPRMQSRWFVLAPLCEIAPSVVHPILRLSARELLSRLDGAGEGRILDFACAEVC